MLKVRSAFQADQTEVQTFCINLFLELLQHCSVTACIAVVFQ